MLQADIWHVAVVHDGEAVVRHDGAQRSDVGRLQAVFRDQRRQRVEGRLDRRADAPLLDRGGEDLVAAAEAFDESFRPRLFGESRSEEHTSELQSLMRISYAVFCFQKKIKTITKYTT